MKVYNIICAIMDFQNEKQHVVDVQTEIQPIMDKIQPIILFTL